MMTPDMDLGTEMTTQHKIDLTHGVVDAISNRVRQVGPGEKKAIGFVVEKRFTEPQNPSVFLEKTFGVLADDPPKEAKWKIFSTVHAVRIEELRKRLAENYENVDELKKLQALEKFMESSHNNARQALEKENPEMHLGSIPDYWLPEWIKKI